MHSTTVRLKPHQIIEKKKKWMESSSTKWKLEKECYVWLWLCGVVHLLLMAGYYYLIFYRLFYPFMVVLMVLWHSNSECSVKVCYAHCTVYKWRKWINTCDDRVVISLQSEFHWKTKNKKIKKNSLRYIFCWCNYPFGKYSMRFCGLAQL